MATAHKILFVLTSCAELGDTGKDTGFHFSEMAEPYYILEDHGVEVTLASINGGKPPIDPGSLKDEKYRDIIKRFHDDSAALKKLENTLSAGDVNMSDYDGIYLPGGHGTMWDFPDDKNLIKLIEDAAQQEKLIGAVCHGPAGLINAKNAEGRPLLENRRINSFTDEEERAIEMDNVVPFLLETKLRAKGALFDEEQPWQAHVVEDGNLITGQNPPSAKLVANALLRCLGISPYKDENLKTAASSGR